MTVISEKMKALGFSLVAESRGCQDWENRERGIRISGKITDAARRPWTAWHKLAGGKEELLCAHGDMFFSGRVRSFGKPENAAKAALEAWA